MQSAICIGKSACTNPRRRDLPRAGASGNQGKCSATCFRHIATGTATEQSHSRRYPSGQRDLTVNQTLRLRRFESCTAH